jgi:hypothetical protein
MRKRPTSTQLRATWNTDSLDTVFLSYTGPSRYQNCCIGGGTSPKCFGYTLVHKFFLIGFLLHILPTQSFFEQISQTCNNAFLSRDFYFILLYFTSLKYTGLFEMSVVEPIDQEILKVFFYDVRCAVVMHY